VPSEATAVVKIRLLVWAIVTSGEREYLCESISKKLGTGHLVAGRSLATADIVLFVAAYSKGSLILSCPQWA
jgi:hypothetical protein